jgi:hypothetical protein
MWITRERVKNNDNDRFAIESMTRKQAETVRDALKESVKGDKYSGVRKESARLWIELDEKLEQN